MGDPRNRFSWLHFSDLQISTRGSLLVQSDFRRAFERDLAAMHETRGPWDYVIVTGDVASRPRNRDYEMVTKVFEELWLFFESLGSRPTLLVVPGNHDDLGGDTAAGPGSAEELKLRFKAFEEWRREWEAARHDVLPRMPGLVPGDFVARRRHGDLRVGLIGINSELMQDKATGRYLADPKHVAQAAGGDLRRWSRQSDVTLLVSHHGPARWIPGHPLSEWSDVPLISLSGGRTQTAPLEVSDHSALIQGLQLHDGSDENCGYLTGSLELASGGMELSLERRRWSAERRDFQSAGSDSLMVIAHTDGASDGRMIAVRGDEAIATLATFTRDLGWRAEFDGELLTGYERGVERWTRQFAVRPELMEMSPGGHWLLLTWPGTLDVLDMQSGATIGTLPAAPGPRPPGTWLDDQRFAFDGKIGVELCRVMPDETFVRYPVSRMSAHVHGVRLMKASPDGARLAVGSDAGLARYRVDDSVYPLTTHVLPHLNVYAVAWSPDSTLLAVLHESGVSIFGHEVEELAYFEVVTDDNESVYFTPDGTLLGHVTKNGTQMWRTSDWSAASPPEVFNTINEHWEKVRSAARTVTAKVVLLGEGNVGKSSLALRMAQGRFEEQEATHAMKFWPVTIDALDPEHRAPHDERREVMFWDMGGQQEYRLLHRAFLRDTMVAVFVMEPRRGEVAFEELGAWVQQLDGGQGGVARLLVASKLDDDTCPRNRALAESMVAAGGYHKYLETSAKAGLGIGELGAAIARSIDWRKLGVTVRSPLFQAIRDVVTVRRESGRVVLSYHELEEIVRQREGGAFDRRAVDAVVEEMARQGLIADLRLAEGTRMLVLEIEQVERYAGSLIIAARDNPRGVPALDSATVTSPGMAFPRIPAERRLRRDQEVVILEAVITMLIEHGICFRSGNMLVFPSLFRAQEGSAPAAGSVATRFDFAGVVDKIYAALVSWLALSQGFGAVRLWPDQAEFVSPDGMCGLRRAGTPVQRRRGEGRLEVFFATETTPEVRRMFVGVTEDFLRRSDVEIVERAEVRCSCGYQITEDVVRARLERGHHDVRCPIDDVQVPLAPSADPGDSQRIRVFRTETEQKRNQVVSEAKTDLNNARRDHAMANPIRILHLSDLHIGAADDAVALLQPLVSDLQDAGDGLGERLDYLVVSGDITNVATPAEFANARAFIEALLADTGISAERCIVVPGNHDLSWTVPVYQWVDNLDIMGVPDPRTHVQQGEGYLRRVDEQYTQRFAAFSEHFFHPLFQRPYHLDPAQQGGEVLFAEHALQFITLNSAWEIDRWFRDRASIHPGAIARTLREADEAVRAARSEKRLADDARLLRLAVWHHPLTGNEKMVDDAFAENLRKAGVAACLHGHIHEDRADLVGYLHPTRKLHVVGAGSFGAPAKHRPESTPQLYNILEIAPDRAAIKVHTRQRRRNHGAWEPWPAWPGATPGERRSWYEIKL